MKVVILVFSLFAGFLFSNPSDSNNSVQTDKISFTLLNKSEKSIPLQIPGVMNPNLSPNSSSGVTLRIGQKVLFKYRGKKRVLLVVDASLKGQKLEVDALIIERKREIDQSR